VPSDSPGEQPETWTRALENFRSLVASTTDWSVLTGCPGWSVADLVSHTIDLESMLATDPRPAHDPNWSHLPHATSDFERRMEVGVDYRRGRSKDELLEELHFTHSRALARLQALSPDMSIPWLRGDTPIPQILSMRTFDIWVHEQDIRVTTGDIGNLDGPGSIDAMRYLTAGLPKVWGKVVGAPIGSVLHMEIVGPGLTGDVWVGVNEDGRADFVDRRLEADVTVKMPWLTFVMLAAGRSVGPRVAESVVVDGEAELADSLLAGMAITP